MPVNKPLVRYISYHNVIKFPLKISSFIIADFASAINEWLKKRRYEPITLDFSGVQNCYSNGMIAIIATIADLRLKNHKFRIILPNDARNRKLFVDKNWAHFLNPEQYARSESVLHRHMVIRQFNDFRDLPFIVNDFMDIVLRSMKIPKDIFSALEWSVHEICDNVINHSNSIIGGFAEVVTYTKNDMISFSVADAGRGILNSLREGIPTLSSDAQAIAEAIKVGVTRNKNVGQGNGLAGSLRITTQTGGSLDIISGTGRFYTTTDDSHKTDSERNRSFKGTIVSGVIRMNNKFSIVKALDFGNPVPYAPVDLIDMDYEMQDQNCLLLRMKNETAGFGTRNSGRQLRIKTLNLIQSKQGYPIVVDWDGIPVISSSFADEFMGKLFLELGPLSFSAIVRNKNMEPLIRALLDKAISQRLKQENQ